MKWNLALSDNKWQPELFTISLCVASRLIAFYGCGHVTFRLCVKCQNRKVMLWMCCITDKQASVCDSKMKTRICLSVVLKRHVSIFQLSVFILTHTLHVVMTCLFSTGNECRFNNYEFWKLVHVHLLSRIVCDSKPRL